jgi:hypothetical protein
MPRIIAPIRREMPRFRRILLSKSIIAKTINIFKSAGILVFSSYIILLHRILYSAVAPLLSKIMTGVSI